MSNRVIVWLPSTTYLLLTERAKSANVSPRDLAGAIVLWAVSGHSNYPLDQERALPHSEKAGLGPALALPGVPEIAQAHQALRLQGRSSSRAIRAALPLLESSLKIVGTLSTYPFKAPRRGPARGTSPKIIRTGDGLGFTAKERERLKTLASAWGMEPEQALRMLVITHLSFVLPGAQAPSCQRVPHAEPPLTPEASS